LYKNIFTIFWRRSQREVIIIIIVSWLSTGDMPSRPDPETELILGHGNVHHSEERAERQRNANLIEVLRHRLSF